MRRMVIKKCNDLREDLERRPTSSVVNELFGEVSGDGLGIVFLSHLTQRWQTTTLAISDELSDASKKAMVEKLAHMTEKASRTLTRVFQWNMQKAQSPAVVPPGEEVSGSSQIFMLDFNLSAVFGGSIMVDTFVVSQNNFLRDQFSSKLLIITCEE